MRVFFHSITKEPEAGRVRMIIQVGAEPTKQFFGEYGEADAKSRFCNVEPEIFMRLSDLAVKKYCNCAIYQMELMGIISAFLSKQNLPPFPIELGTTSFGLTRPTPAKILFDRLTRPFYIAWLWWTCRHIRRENILKDGKEKA